MPRNPFEEDNRPHEVIKGEDVVNIRTERIVRIRNQDGTYEDIVTNVRESRPDGNGNFIDTELINVVTDHAGNPLPEDPRSVFFSHSDLFIRSQEQLAICTSWLHPPNRSRNILLGQDGRTVQGGAICSNCDSWQTTIYIAFGILGLGVLTGLCKAAGLF
jgi:hypothetical protein